ncbi:MAG TPA: DUF6585 family protein [bacterium]|nr:DUF6585 family protein [bacterium]
MNLGKPIKEYQSSTKSFVKVAILSLVSLGIAALCFSGAFGANAGWDRKIVFSILGLLFLTPVAAGIYVTFTRRGSSASLYENGLVYRMGGKEFSTTWDQIVSLMESTACRVEKSDGESFDLGRNVEGYDEIAGLLHEESLKRLMPKAKAVIDRGGSFSFQGLKSGGKIPLGKALPDSLVGGGSFSVDSTGIALVEAGTKIAWSEVQNFGVRQGEGRRAGFAFFFIGDGKLEYQMNYGALPNAHLLLAICAERTPHLAKTEV